MIVWGRFARLFLGDALQLLGIVNGRGDDIAATRPFAKIDQPAAVAAEGKVLAGAQHQRAAGGAAKGLGFVASHKELDVRPLKGAPGANFLHIPSATALGYLCFAPAALMHLNCTALSNHYQDYFIQSLSDYPGHKIVVMGLSDLAATERSRHKLFVIAKIVNK